MYPLAVPASTDSSIVVTDGDSAEWTEEGSDLDIKDVRQIPFELSSLQKHLQDTQSTQKYINMSQRQVCIFSMCGLFQEFCPLSHMKTNNENEENENDCLSAS